MPSLSFKFTVTSHGAQVQVGASQKKGGEEGRRDTLYILGDWKCDAMRNFQRGASTNPTSNVPFLAHINAQRNPSGMCPESTQRCALPRGQEAIFFVKFSTVVNAKKRSEGATYASLRLKKWLLEESVRRHRHRPLHLESQNQPPNTWFSAIGAGPPKGHDRA